MQCLCTYWRCAPHIMGRFDKFFRTFSVCWTWSFLITVWHWLYLVGASVQSILFILCILFLEILKTCTSYYGQFWQMFSKNFCMLNLLFVFITLSHWAIPSMCNHKFKKCSFNIIQTLHSVYINSFIKGNGKFVCRF